MSAAIVNVLAHNPPLNLNPENYAARAAAQPISDYAPSADAAPISDYALPGDAPAAVLAVDYAETLNNHLADIGGEPAGAPDASWMQIVQLANLPMVSDSRQEKEDDKHRMGDLLKVCLKIYNDKNVVGKTFYQWLDSIPEWERIAMIRDTLAKMSKSPFTSPRVAGRPAAAGPSHAAPAPFATVGGPDRTRNINPSVVRAFLYGVKYLDRAARKQYRLTISGGLANLNGHLFDTRDMKTVFSGRGSAIWVQSPKDNFYAGNHVKGHFHHSSFLSGGEVKCGGEMQASQGTITRISAKSGHYKPSKDHFANALRSLGQLGVNLNALQVVVWKKGRDYDPASVIPASIFLRDSSQWETWGNGAIPNNAS